MAAKMKKQRNYIDFILYAILFLLPFLHVNIGVNLYDQGYNLVNFEMFPEMNQMWMIATLFANVVGKLLTYLPFGHYMLGMNMYCTLLLAVTAVVIFYILKKDYSKYAVFAGLVLAICLSWSPKVTLYQYLSYYLFSFAVIILVKGLVKCERRMLFGAGILLGINLFVRFPNVLQVALIIVVIYAAILQKKQPMEFFIDVLVCMAGYFAVAVPVILAVELLFGSGAYLGMIDSLFTMTDTATSYKPVSMLNAVYKSYFENWKWVKWFLVEAAAAVISYGFMRKKWMKYSFSVLLGFVFLFILRVYWYWGVFNIKYTKYESITVWGVCFLVLAMLVMIYGIAARGISEKTKLYALAVLIIILITPLGGNNALYYNYNNLYLAAPVTLGILSSVFQKSWTHEKERTQVHKIWNFSVVPLALVCGMLTGIILLQSFLFHMFFIYGDAGILAGAKSKVEGNKILTGMVTAPETAEALQGVQAFIEENELEGKETIVWAHSPMLFYALELPCAISHTWPSLDSYPVDELEQDLEDMEDYPMVVYQAQYYEDLIHAAPEWDRKAHLITAVLQEGNYEEVYRNEYYAVCLPAE